MPEPTVTSGKWQPWLHQQAGVTVREQVRFFSECPECHHRRLQHGYEQVELAESLSTHEAIDAYCLPCDALWTISDQERTLLATLVKLVPN